MHVKSSKGRGRPSGETPRAVIEYINSIAPPVLHDDPQPQFTPSSTTKKLTCPICINVVYRPVEFCCDNIVCCACCCTAIQSTGSLNCPCCRDHTLSSATIHPPSHLLMSLINDLVVSCTRKCGSKVKYEKYEEHLSSNCRNYCENVDSPSKVTLRDVLCKPSTSPATPVEVKAAHHLVKRLMHHGQGPSSSTPERVRLQSPHGQVYVIIFTIQNEIISNVF